MSGETMQMGTSESSLISLGKTGFDEICEDGNSSASSQTLFGEF
jgi:hypothetical protein